MTFSKWLCNQHIPILVITLILGERNPITEWYSNVDIHLIPSEKIQNEQKLQKQSHCNVNSKMNIQSRILHEILNWNSKLSTFNINSLPKRTSYAENNDHPTPENGKHLIMKTLIYEIVPLDSNGLKIKLQISKQAQHSLPRLSKPENSPVLLRLVIDDTVSANSVN